MSPIMNSLDNTPTPDGSSNCFPYIQTPMGSYLHQIEGSFESYAAQQPVVYMSQKSNPDFEMQIDASPSGFLDLPNNPTF